MLTHIINPVAADPATRFYFIQQITFQSMLTAQNQAGDQEVSLLSAQYPEDHPMLFPGFGPTLDLVRSVLDVAQFQIPRKLPILQDILNRAYEQSSSPYVIYTNVDIGVQPHFYQTVARFIEQGYDSFVINRRTISDHYSSLTQMDQIYQDAGKAHRGWDCFVFPRSWIPDFRLGAICIGAPLVGLAFLSNLLALSKNFKEFREEHLTFHLGDDKVWNRKKLDDYRQHNYTQLMMQLSQLIEIHGMFPPTSAPARFLGWQSNPVKATVYRLYSRYPLPLAVARWFKRDQGSQK
jgi:hypothetical protein